MARKLAYPSWLDWQNYLEDFVAVALRESGLTGYRIGNGAATSKAIPVKSPDQQVKGTVPYVEVLMVDHQEHWNDEASYSPNPQGYSHQVINGVSTQSSRDALKERVTWTITVVSRQYKELLPIVQVLRRYFEFYKDLRVVWQGETQSVGASLHDYKLSAAEDENGNVDLFVASWALTLFLKTEPLEANKISKAISQIVIGTTAELGSAEGEEETKTIS